MSEKSSWPAEEIEYLEEVLSEYERYVENIGENGLAAPLLLYYRDELQETLTDLEGKVPLQLYWAQTVELDQKVRSKCADLVGEIGWESYRMQRAARTPPKSYWWWHLDSTLSPPAKTGRLKSWWEWLKKP